MNFTSRSRGKICPRFTTHLPTDEHPRRSAAPKSPEAASRCLRSSSRRVVRGEDVRHRPFEVLRGKTCCLLRLVCWVIFAPSADRSQLEVSKRLCGAIGFAYFQTKAV